MLRTIAELKAVVDKWVGNLHVDPNTPVPVVKDMCAQFVKYLEGIEEKAKADQSAQKSSETAPEPSKEASNG